MFKRFIITVVFCLCVVYIDCSFLHASSNTGSQSARTYSTGLGFAYYPRELHRIIEMVQKLPEARKLLNEIQKEGWLGIDFHKGADFQAFWNGSRRAILLNPDQLRTDGAYICSILFELHNASSEKRLAQLSSLATRGMISKDQYVEDVERVEHRNALSTCTLLNKGVRKGIFPRDASWGVYQNFDDHYRVQQMTGHSEWLAKSYDEICRNRKTDPFRGTMQEFKSLPHEGKQDLFRYLAIKNDLESSHRDQIARGTRRLQEEYAGIEAGYSVESSAKISLLEKIFKGNPVFETMIQKSTMFSRIGH